MSAIHHQPAQQLSATHAPALAVRGMHGLGDNLHQRGIVRHLMQRAPVWLETSWPWVYHDLAGPRLHLQRKGAPSEIYLRNQQREAAQFSEKRAPADASAMRIIYTPPDVRSAGSVLAGMCRRTGVDFEACADFRLPIRPEWDVSAAAMLEQWGVDKPLMIFRPLVERSWWLGCTARNPNHAAYAALYRSIRDRYFVLSVAELSKPGTPPEEWQVGEAVDVDLTCHHGEIPTPVLAALVARAALVFTAPGFGVILAQAVGTPSVAVFGGYENSRSFTAGSRWAPYLGIDPIDPCACFTHDHACRKEIHMLAAMERLEKFVSPRSEQDETK